LLPNKVFALFGSLAEGRVEPDDFKAETGTLFVFSNNY